MAPHSISLDHHGRQTDWMGVGGTYKLGWGGIDTGARQERLVAERYLPPFFLGAGNAAYPVDAVALEITAPAPEGAWTCKNMRSKIMLSDDPVWTRYAIVRPVPSDPPPPPTLPSSHL